MLVWLASYVLIGEEDLIHHTNFCMLVMQVNFNVDTYY